MNSRKFSLGIIGVVMALVATVFVLAWVLPEERYMDGEYAYWKQQKDYILKDSNRQEIILLGDSRMKQGVFPKELHTDAYNLAISGTSPVEMYYTLIDYMAHHPTPKMVIIAFGPMHYDDEDIVQSIERDAYFHYFSHDRLIEINEVYKTLDGYDLPNKITQYAYRMPSIYFKPVLRSIFKPLTRRNKETYNRVTVEKGHMPNGTKTVVNVIPPERKINLNYSISKGSMSSIPCHS